MSGNKIKFLRQVHALTQTELADRLGMDQSALCKLERERARPSIELLTHISRHYGIPLQDLIDPDPFEVVILGKQGIIQPLKIIKIGGRKK